MVSLSPKIDLSTSFIPGCDILVYVGKIPYMEFSSPVYELLFLYQLRGIKFPPYWDLMTESAILDLIPREEPDV